jgi:hypothetical protein
VLSDYNRPPPEKPSEKDRPSRQLLNGRRAMQKMEERKKTLTFGWGWSGGKQDRALPWLIDGDEFLDRVLHESHKIVLEWLLFHLLLQAEAE